MLYLARDLTSVRSNRETGLHPAFHAKNKYRLVIHLLTNINVF